MLHITVIQRRTAACFLLILLILLSCTGCGSQLRGEEASQQEHASGLDVSHFLVAVEDEPDTVDFQCTSIYYTIAQNVFNRLVEMEAGADGTMEILPSLAKSWEVSGDGRSYTFHLRENVSFSNGSPLTASDVLYTFQRLLTHPDSCNRDIVDGIAGAAALASGETDQLVRDCAPSGLSVLGGTLSPH